MNSSYKLSKKSSEGLDKLRFTFGRLRLITIGHLDLSSKVDVVGISEKSKPLDSVNVLKKLEPNKEAKYARTVGELIASFPENQKLTIVLGADQEAFGRSLVKSYKGRLDLEILPREPGAPSSSAARVAIDENKDLIKLKLARDADHAELMKQQRAIERSL
jgi:hypothetical protein